MVKENHNNNDNTTILRHSNQVIHSSKLTESAHSQYVYDPNKEKILHWFLGALLISGIALTVISLSNLCYSRDESTVQAISK